MSRIRSNTFQELSFSYYLTVILMAFVGSAVFYLLLGSANLSERNHILFSIVGGVILTPIIVVSIISLWLLAVVSYVLVRVYLFSYKDDKNNFFVQDALASSFSAVSVDLPMPDITRRALHVREKDFSVKFTYEQRTIIWQQFASLSIVRVAATRSGLPILIIDAQMNDRDTSQFDAKKLSMSALDLGSDFGSYFSIYVPKGTELNAYQLLTPDFMIESIAMLKGMDVVMGEDYVDFVFRQPDSTKALMERVAVIRDYTQGVESSTKRKHSFAQTAHNLRRSAKSVNKIAGKCTVILLFSFLVFVSFMSVYSAVSGTGAQLIAAIPAAIAAISFVCMVGSLAVIGYSFGISYIAGIIIASLNELMLRRKRRNYAHINQKYWRK